MWDPWPSCPKQPHWPSCLTAQPSGYSQLLSPPGGLHSASAGCTQEALGSSPRNWGGRHWKEGSSYMQILLAILVPQTAVN